MALRAKDADFENFASQARSLMGNDLSDDWLQEMWSGADGDLNRALNHVLDSPPDKIGRTGGMSAPAASSAPAKSTKSPKKKKHSKTSAPPPPPPPAWDDEYDDPFFAAPAPAPAPPPAPASQPPPVQQQAPPPPQFEQQQIPQHMPATAPQMGTPMQQNPYPYPTQQAPQMMQTMPAMGQGAGMMDSGVPTTTPNAMAASLQQQQRMQFMQTQQQQVLMTLKAQLDTVLANPGLLQDVAAMHQLKDTMSMAMEAPNATIQMNEQARQNQQAAEFIRLMQAQIAEMLSNPQVASNPELLQQLNTQMNQLRLITMQQVASENLSSNPVTALSLPASTNSVRRPLTTDDIKNMLEDMSSDSDSDEDDDDMDDDDAEWWGNEAEEKSKGDKKDKNKAKKHVSFDDSPKKDSKRVGSDQSLSESNPFKEPEAEDETVSDGEASQRSTSKKDRKGSKKSKSNKDGLKKLMKQLMAVQSQMNSSAGSQTNPMFPNNSTPVLPNYAGSVNNLYNMSQAGPLPPQSMSTMMPPTGYATSATGAPMMYQNPTAGYPQQQPQYY